MGLLTEAPILIQCLALTQSLLQVAPYSVQLFCNTKYKVKQVISKLLRCYNWFFWLWCFLNLFSKTSVLQCPSNSNYAEQNPTLWSFKKYRLITSQNFSATICTITRTGFSEIIQTEGVTQRIQATIHGRNDTLPLELTFHSTSFLYTAKKVSQPSWHWHRTTCIEWIFNSH